MSARKRRHAQDKAHVITVSPAVLVCTAVARDPARYMDQKITPFVTPRQLMGGSAPSRWRLFARRRWFARLSERVTREIARQERFVGALNLVTRGVRPGAEVGELLLERSGRSPSRG